MEVLLKKTKINSNILSQTVISSNQDFNPEYVLGWCFYKQIKFIVFHNNGNLSKFPFFNKSDILIDYLDKDKKSLNIKIFFNPRQAPRIFTFNDNKKADEFKNLLYLISDKSIEKGQFFI